MVHDLFLQRIIEETNWTCNHTCHPSEEWEKGEASKSPFCHLQAETKTNISTHETQREQLKP